MRNENGLSGVLAGVFILVIAIIAVVSIIYLTNIFDTHYNSVNKDPLNNTGILSNGTESYSLVKETNTTLIDNTAVVIFIALLIAIILLLLAVKLVLSNE